MMDDVTTRLYSPAARGTRAPFAALLQALRRSVVQWLKWRATVKELRQLRDRELRDIGLRRDQIPDVVSDLLGETRKRWDRGPD